MSRSKSVRPADLGDVEAAVEAIRVAVRKNAGFASAADVPPLQHSNEITELSDLAVVSAHLPVSWSTPFVGQAIALSKRAARLLLRWYINPIVDQQNSFNDAVVRTIATLDERLLEIERTLARAEQETDE